ncbi:A-kinase anchor protein 10, mitochondrial-like isoform X2 [Watersipora subatra]|uniref:A-kinase anchor protein 10, mitochondrial-like isoform X2 n=1 Tax=Watersipora subatra TaxID=2589382 RepID=UPI00355B37B6
MPFFNRKKSEKHNSKSTKSKSQFYQEPLNTEKESVNTREHTKKEKRRSRSTFYDVTPDTTSLQEAADTVSVESDHSHASSTSKNSVQVPPPALALETQGDLGQSHQNNVWCRRTSILSITFFDMLHNQDLIGQFIQYMATKDREHLVKFWLDSKNFSDASLSRIRVHSLHAVIDTQPTDNRITDSGDPPSSDHQQDTLLQERIKADAVNIYSRYIALDCQSPIGITEELRKSTISKICSEDGKVDPLCFKECQKFIEDILEKSYFEDFVESSYYRRYQLQQLVDRKLHLIDILYNEVIMFYFLEFAEQENASALLQFWMAVDNFQGQLESDLYSAKEAQSDAMILYEKYFSLQASDPLGFSDKIRMHVELNICREEGPLPDCFLIPKIIILETIEKTLFKPFLQSQIYFRYLSELIGSNQHADSHTGTPKAQTKKSHSRKGSNTSSYDTQSLGGRSLPDNDVAEARQSRLPGIDDDACLRRRVHHRKSMSLGHLSEYGQYVSELDLEQVPDLYKNKGNRFSRKKREKERAQEAMAWEVTKMIIANVKEEVSWTNNHSIPEIRIEHDTETASSSQITEL